MSVGGGSEGTDDEDQSPDENIVDSVLINEPGSSDEASGSEYEIIFDDDDEGYLVTVCNDANVCCHVFLSSCDGLWQAEAIVYRLFCKGCGQLICNRAQSVTLLADGATTLFSTDFVTDHATEVGEVHEIDCCQCLIRKTACRGCAQAAVPEGQPPRKPPELGYHVVGACAECSEANNNGHYWLFHRNAVLEEATPTPTPTPLPTPRLYPKASPVATAGPPRRRGQRGHLGQGRPGRGGRGSPYRARVRAARRAHLQGALVFLFLSLFFTVSAVVLKAIVLTLMLTLSPGRGRCVTK